MFSDLSEPFLVGPEHVLDVWCISPNMLEKPDLRDLVILAADYIPL
jgi:hypothetical protein